MAWLIVGFVCTFTAPLGMFVCCSLVTHIYVDKIYGVIPTPPMWTWNIAFLSTAALAATSLVLSRMMWKRANEWVQALLMLVWIANGLFVAFVLFALIPLLLAIF